MIFAQEARPLRIIVPFPPGGATDITARSLQEPLSRILKQPVVLENRGGAGGSIGMAEVARAPADGLVLGVATLSTHGVNPAVYSKLPYDPIKDFVGVTEIVRAPGVIVVNPAVLPVKDLAELVKYLKANPGKVSYATPGNGTIGHMWGELFKRSSGTSMVHIAYRGAGPAINDVLAGQVGVYFDQVASSLPHIKAASSRRWPCPGAAGSTCCPRCRPTASSAMPPTTTRRGSGWSRPPARRPTSRCACSRPWPPH